MSLPRKLPHSLFSGKKAQFKISENQLKVLSTIQIDGGHSAHSIAKATHLSEAIVRRTLSQLTDQGIIHRRTVINPYAIGYTMYGVLLRCSGRIYERREDLIAFLVASPRVSYVGEIGGAFALRIGLVTRRNEEKTDFFDILAERFGDLVEEKSVLALEGLVDYPLQCIGASPKSKPLAIVSHTRQHDADDVDIKILRRVSEIGDGSTTQIAREIGIPPTTVEYRISRMRERGIIVGSRYLIDISKFGYSSFVQFVKIRGCGRDTRASMYEFCLRHPNIYYSVHFCGTWDFEIGTIVENASDIVGVSNGLYATYKDQLLALETLPLLRYYKVSNFPCDTAE
jgi:DNA-binding Lrp family transcriptional regulator